MFGMKNAVRGGQVLFLPVCAIRKNPQQPRKNFVTEELQDLADSIALYGVLQPLTVRAVSDGWELVAGERRLRAAKLAGLREVPCLPVEAGEAESGLIAMIENLQRKDLSFLEEARGIRNLLDRYGFSQGEAARRLGKSQSAIANKLRLLQHEGEVLDALEERGLTERHARALLRLKTKEEKLALIEKIVREDWSVSRLEQFLDAAPKGAKFAWRPGMLRDLRLFFGSVEHAIMAVRHAGFNAQTQKQETEEEIILTIRLPKGLA